VRLLIHDARLIATMDDARRRLPGGWVLVEDDRIAGVGSGEPPATPVDRRLDARGKVVLPGLVNTHHHLPQSLTRNVPRVQEAPLFRWLVELYEVWRGTDAEAVEVAARVGLGELLLTGCTTSTDHLYLFPRGHERLIDAEIGAARDLGYPVVLKALSDDIAHKTELGLVAVGLKNGEELAHAFARLSERLDRLDPPPSERAFLVQEFVADGVELFAGVSRDPDFGLSLAVGMGGTAIEVTRDFALRMLPLREGDAEAMIAEVRGAALLASVRGRPAADVGSVVACLEALADFAQQNADVLDEVDLNPIKALPQGRGCVVVDALIVARAPARG